MDVYQMQLVKIGPSLRERAEQFIVGKHHQAVVHGPSVIVQQERQLGPHCGSARPMRWSSRIVRCGCGRIMSGATLNPKNPHSYYICSVARSYFANLEERTCFEKFADAEKLETAVWEFYLDILRNPETFKAKLQRAQQLELEEQEPKRQELESVNTLILEAEAEATQL